MAKAILLLMLFAVRCSGAPTKVELPAYVIKFVALFPNSVGPMPHCDHNTSPKNRNPCDYRVHFDVLFPDDPYMIPYADLEYSLPDSRDYYIAEPTATNWRAPLPTPSYPGDWQSLAPVEYEQILRHAAGDRPILFRITVFDRDDVGSDDVMAQELFTYTLDDVLKQREHIQTKSIKCRPEAKCRAIRIKFMFYLLEKPQEKRSC